jgi:hypothetical protein
MNAPTLVPATSTRQAMRGSEAMGDILRVLRHIFHFTLSNRTEPDAAKGQA